MTLEGATVVVTRPRSDADELARALAAAGARVLAFPVVEIAEPADGGAALSAAAANLGRYRWVAFTSANAVQRLLAALPGAARRSGVAPLPGVSLAAVGPATAAALAERGLSPDLVATRASAEGLAEVFPAPPSPGAAVLFPASAGARPTLPDALRAKGWDVDVVEAYRTVPAPPPAASVADQLGSATAVTFASPSAVEGYVMLRDVRGRRLPVPGVVACIGPVTAAAARAAGLAVAVVAPSASAAALVRALDGALVRALDDALDRALDGARAEDRPRPPR